MAGSSVVELDVFIVLRLVMAVHKLAGVSPEHDIVEKPAVTKGTKGVGELVTMFDLFDLLPPCSST
jgi:hypothetical protein